MHSVIVDPSRVVQKLLAEQMLQRGDQVSIFSDSCEALAYIRGNKAVTLLITSLEVSPLTGLELCWYARLLASVKRPLYVLVMSSAHDSDNVAQALDCGADDLVMKPIRPQELFARLRVVSRLHEAQLRLLQIAETDVLTGLLNRGAFFSYLNELLESEEGSQPLSAIMLDIDHFKRINDTFGHQFGDEVIKGFAGQIAKVDGITGRLGGEEFAVILPDCTRVQALAIAENLRLCCAGLEFESESGPLRITCSLGVSHWQSDDTVDSLMKRADIALYQAKNNGRNRVQVVDEICENLHVNHYTKTVRSDAR